jgi:phage-related minor tail protein
MLIQLTPARAGLALSQIFGKFRLLLIWSWLGLLLAGCTPLLIAHRNQQLLDDTKALQQKTDLFLIKLQRACGQPAGEYTSNTNTHDELKAAASSLQVAADAIPKNTLTSQQIALLRSDYQQLDSLHRIRCNPVVLEISRRLLNTHFTALITLEEAKTN